MVYLQIYQSKTLNKTQFSVQNQNIEMIKIVKLKCQLWVTLRHSIPLVTQVLMAMRENMIEAAA